MTQPVGTDELILAGLSAGVGELVLNRPRAINALSLSMVTDLDRQLRAWAELDAVRVVVISGAGERGLCAGGDVRAISAPGVGEDDATRFFLAEYAMNQRIAEFPKPILAWMDGVVMGGGLGVSAHASHRLVTERARIAMPETIIGFYPDVGMLWRLAQAPGELGTHLALTGRTVSGRDAVAIGFADAIVDPGDRDAVLRRLRAGELPEPAAVGDSLLLEARGWIDECYTGDDAGAILRRLRAHDNPEARRAGDELAARCPMSVVIALAGLRRARGFDQATGVSRTLEFDRRLAPRMAARGDFAEGVRAQLIDKDGSPRWSDASLADVDPEEVARLLEGTPR